MSNDLELKLRLTTDGGKVVVKSLQQVDAASEKVNDELNRMNGAGRNAKQGFDSASKGATKFNSNATTTTQQLDLLSVKTAILGTGLFSLAYGFTSLSGNMYDGIDTFQRYRAQLKTITGDFNSASVELNRLVDFAAKTPFTLEQSVQGFAKLTHLGLEPSEAAMLSYGNTSSAMGKDLMQMIEAVADASVGEFERLKEFGIKASSQSDKVRFTFQGVATEIKKDAASIEQYLQNIGNSKFATAMLDQMTTLSAQASNLDTEILRLYDTFGQQGAADGFGDIIAVATGAVVLLRENLPEAIHLMSTFSDIIMVGGALYIGARALPVLMNITRAATLSLTTQVYAASLAYSAGVTSISMFTASLRASTTATYQAVAANGLLTSSLQLMFAAYAGWEIGSYIRDEFVEARVAGLAFVGAMETGFSYLSFAFTAVGTTINHAWESTLNSMFDLYGGFLSMLASGAKSLGLDDLSEKLEQWKNSAIGNIEPQGALADKIASLTAARDKDIAQIDKHIVALIKNEYAAENSNKSNEKAVASTEKKVDVTTKELTANQKLISSLGVQVKLLSMTSKEKAVYNAVSKLSADATHEEVEAVKALTLALIEQQDALVLQKELTDGTLTDFIDDVDNLGSAFSNTGNVIVDAFGSVSDVFNNLIANQEKYDALLQESAEKKIAISKNDSLTAQEKADAIQQLADAEIKLNKRNTAQQLGSYAAISSSAAQMFSEESKGRETLMKLSQAFTAAELLMSAQRIGTYALEAITAAFAAPWPIGAISGSAMIATMIGLGAYNGGGNAPTSAADRQQNQGAGSVLGSDGKSSSIENSYERIFDLELDQYAELRQMNNSLRDLNNNLTHLTTSLVANYGRFDESSYNGSLGTTKKFDGDLFGSGKGGATLGLGALALVNPLSGILTFGLNTLFGGVIDSVLGNFSKTKKTLLDSGLRFNEQDLGSIINSGSLDVQSYADIKTKKSSFWGLSSKTSYDTQYQDVDAQIKRELGLVFGGIGDTITSALGVLGVDAEKALETFVLQSANISLKGLSGDEIKAELQAVVSQAADGMAQYVLPSVTQFQQVGEGLFDTLTRLAQEQAIFNNVLQLTEQSLRGLTGIDAVGITQQIIEFGGGIEAMGAAASAYFDAFFDDSEKFTFLQNQLNDQFSALGSTLPTTRDGFKELIKGLDLTSEADARLYAQLLPLSDLLDNYYKQTENGIKLLREEAEARANFNASIAKSFAQLDMTELEKSLDNLNTKFNEELSQALDAGADVQLLENYYGRMRTDIIRKHLTDAETTFHTAIENIGDELAKLVDSITDTRSGIAASVRDIKREMGGFDEISFLTGNINSLYGQIGTGSISEQISAVDDLRDTIMQRYEFERDQFNELSTLSLDKYQQELEQYSSLQSALKDVGRYTRDLSLSEHSPLGANQRLNVARGNYYNDLNGAQNFDLDAIANITQSADAYLAEARNMFGSSSMFSAIFNSVQAGLTQVSGLEAGMPVEPTETEKYQQSTVELQTNAITELQGLNALLATLETQANEQAVSETQLATEQFNEQRDLIAQTNELSKQQLDEQKQMHNELRNQNAQQSQMINLLQQQLNELRSVSASQSELASHQIHDARQV